MKIDIHQKAHMIASNIIGRATDEDGGIDVIQLVNCIEELLESHAEECEKLIAEKEHAEQLYEDLNRYVERHYDDYV